MLSLFPYIEDMSYFSSELKQAMADKGLTVYKVALEAKVDSGLLYRIINGKRGPSDDIIHKLASVAELCVSVNQMRAWKLFDEYDRDVIQAAIKHFEKGEQAP